MSAIDFLEARLRTFEPDRARFCLQCLALTLNERICDRPECQRAEAEREAAE